MVNWKAFKILEIQEDKVFEFTICKLDGYGGYWVEQKWKGEVVDFNLNDRVYCNSNCFANNGCQAGDYLEIDVDRVKLFHELHKLLDASVVRKFGSSAVVPSSSAVSLPSISQNQVNTMIGQINSAINSDERNEYEAKVHVDPNSGKYSGFSMIGRRK